MTDQQDPSAVDPPPKPKRVRGKGKKRKYVKRAPGPTNDPETLPDQYSAVASAGDVGDDDLAKLRAQVADLNAKLEDERAKRGAAEAAALASAEAQSMLMQRDIQEYPTGKTVKVRRASGYSVKGYKEDGREILKPIWAEVELPTYFYKVDLPPCGGTDFKINGQPYYHGATYEFDIDTLRTAKDIVARCWAHDKEIHGTDENFYRRVDPNYQARNARAIRAGVFK